jgi:hypothetical protein
VARLLGAAHLVALPVALLAVVFVLLLVILGTIVVGAPIIVNAAASVIVRHSCDWSNVR